jgi:hypothetical protein
VSANRKGVGRGGVSQSQEGSGQCRPITAGKQSVSANHMSEAVSVGQVSANHSRGGSGVGQSQDET